MCVCVHVCVCLCKCLCVDFSKVEDKQSKHGAFSFIITFIITFYSGFFF